MPKEFENKLILGSAENMKELPNNSIHLMITSPPYNVSKECDDDLSLQPSGIYLLQIKSGERMEEQKIVKQ